MTDTVQHLVIMGVTGSGKTTLAQVLARRLGWLYIEADDAHTRENVEKMRAGLPLTDADRWPWLEALRDELTAQARAGRSSILTCSALKDTYRDVLRGAEGRVRFVFLTAPPAVLRERMSHREGHFMSPALLDSQLEALQPPGDDEDGVTVTVDVPPERVADRTLQALGLGQAEATSAAGPSD